MSSGRQVWNYTKRPERGASCVQVWLDGLLVHSGSLRRAPRATVGDTAQFAQAILFTNNAAVVERNQSQVGAGTTRLVRCGQCADTSVTTAVTPGRVLWWNRASCNPVQ